MARKGLNLLEAIRELYYAGVWHCDRPVDEAKLWTAVRDAAGFEQGKSPREIVRPASRDEDLRELLEATQDYYDWNENEYHKSPVKSERLRRALLGMREKSG
jgi:hypothetical protein